MASSNSRCASSRNTTSFGLRQVAGLGQRLEQLGDQPHQRRRPQRRLVLHRGELDARDHAAPVVRQPQQVGDIELRLAEELRAAAGLEPDAAPAAARRPSPPTARRSPRAPACPRPSPGTSAARAGRPGRAAAGPSSRRSGRPAPGSTPASRWRRAPWRAAAARSPTPSRAAARPGPSPPSARNSTGNADGANGSPSSVMRFSRRAAGHRLGGAASPDTSPLTSATSTGTPARESCSASTCSVFVLPVPGRARDEPVAVHRRQRHAHRGRGMQRALVHAAPEVDRVALGRVGGGDRGGESACHAAAGPRPPRGLRARRPCRARPCAAAPRPASPRRTRPRAGTRAPGRATAAGAARAARARPPSRSGCW